MQPFSKLLADLADAISAAEKYLRFATLLQQQDLTAEICTEAGSEGRFYRFDGGRMTSQSGLVQDPDVELVFRSPDIALKVLSPDREHAAWVEGVKNLRIRLLGDELKAIWFHEILVGATEAPVYFSATPTALTWATGSGGSPTVLPAGRCTCT